MKTIKLICQQ